jgi:hypothetical protein
MLLLIKRDASSGWSVEQKQNLAEGKKKQSGSLKRQMNE